MHPDQQHHLSPTPEMGTRHPRPTSLRAWLRRLNTRTVVAVVLVGLFGLFLLNSRRDSPISTSISLFNDHNTKPLVPTFWHPRPGERKLLRYRANNDLVSIIVTVFDQEDIVGEVIQAILSTTVGPYELILIFDGCTDASEQIVDSKIRRHRQSLIDHPGRGLVKYSKTVNRQPLYETLSNNIGFRAAVGRYLIIVQDDMKMADYGWDRIILNPLLQNPDILALSGRGAHNDYADPGQDRTHMGEVAGNTNYHNYWIDHIQKTVEIRDICFRGPWIMSAERGERLGWLNETYAPFEMDDHEICLRGKRLHNYKCAWYPVSVRSETSWSHRRKGQPRPPQLSGAEAKNMKLLTQAEMGYLSSPRPHATPSREIEAWGFEQVPRTIFTVIGPSDFAAVTALYRSITTHEPQSRFVIYLIKSSISRQDLTAMEIWTRAEIRFIPPTSVKSSLLGVAAGVYGREEKASQKMWALHEVMSRFGGLVLWLDPGAVLKDRLDLVVWRNVANTGVWGFKGNGNIVDTTHPSTLEALNGLRVLQNQRCDGRIFGFNTQVADIMNSIVRPMLECSHDPDCLSPPNPEERPHGHDASVLSVLLAKSRFECNGGEVERVLDLGAGVA